MKKVILYLFFTLLIVSTSFAIDSKTITINLEYGNQIGLDTNNDGIEYESTPIDFTVENSNFSWSPNSSNLCTLWEIADMDSSEKYNTCMGQDSCCSFVDTISISDNWNDPLNLEYGIGGTKKNNKISATIVYLDYSFSPENTYSEIAFSEKEYLYGVFIKAQRKTNSQEIPIIITSPQNNSFYSSGENIYLNFTLNESKVASYSIDNSNYIQLGNNSTFNTVIIGNLENNILSNNLHSINIFLMENSSNFYNYTQNFVVNDSFPPNLDLLYQLSNLNNSVINSSNQELTLTVYSDEYTKIKYSLNGLDKKELTVSNYSQFKLNASSSNLLWINASDVHNNYLIYSYNFEYQQNPTCSDNIQNGNELGIDCGGNCNTCIPFNISMTKSNYNLSESIKITVLSRENSNVNISLFKNNNIIYNDLITSYSPGFPIFVTKPLSNINSEGNYLVHAKMIYLNNTEEKYLTFSVEDDTQNPLDVIITSNATTINEKETIKLQSTVTGSTGTVSYLWRFHDGTTSTSPSIDKSYNSNGTFKVNLTVSQNEWSAFDTKTITVKKLFNISVLVKNSSGGVIKDAIVEINNIEKNTTNSGITSFLINPGNIDLDVSKPGYTTHSNITNIQKALTLNINLSKISYDSTPPIITILSPADDNQITTPIQQFKFKVKDSSTTDCTLYLSIDDNWWSESGSQTGIVNENEISITYNKLENKAYQWKIECMDKLGNSEISTTRNFVVNSAQAVAQNELTSDDSTIDSSINMIDNVLGNINSFSKVEKDIAISLRMEENLEKTRKELERAKRDLHNLVWRRVNSSEMDLLREEILSKIQSLKDSVPKSISVVKSGEFVQYPSDDEIEEVAEAILDQENNKVSDKELKKYHNFLKNLQKKISIATKYYVADVTFLSGESSRISIIDKSISTKKELGEYSIIDVIPKSIAESTDKINALFDFEVIKEDPIIKMEGPIDSYTYFVRKEVTETQVKEIISVIASKPSKDSNSITGFSVFSSIPRSLVETSNVRLMIEVIIIIALIMIYLAFSGNFSKLIFTIKHFKSLKEIKVVRNKLKKGIDLINNDKYDESKKIYQNVNSEFKELPKSAKKDLLKKIKLLAAKLNVYHMNKLLDKAEFQVEGKQKKEAAKIYKQVSGLYNVLPKKYKQNIIERCKKLHEALHAK